MKKLITAICIVLIFSITGYTGTKTVIVRTNPGGYGTTTTAKPLMTYQQAETMIRQNLKIIRQNEEIIKLLRKIERNSRK
jgi:uncharacterized membrane protein